MEKMILGVELSNGKNAAMERKALEGITLCPEGATVLLHTWDLQRYTGIFEGITEEESGKKVMLKSLTSTQRIGLPIEGIAEWYQEVDGGAKPYEQSEGFDAIDTEEEQPYGKLGNGVFSRLDFNTRVKSSKIGLGEAVAEALLEGDSKFYEVLTLFLCTILPYRFGNSSVPTEEIVKDAVAKYEEKMQQKNQNASIATFIEYIRIYRENSSFITPDFDFDDFQREVEKRLRWIQSLQK